MKKVLSQKHKDNISKGMINYWNKHRDIQIQKNGYATISIGNKKIYYHRYLMEQHLERKLKYNEQVHHINGNKLDNRIENLIVMNSSNHLRKHALNNNLGKDRKGKEPTNKTPKNIINEIRLLRKQGYLIRKICEKTNISYPTAIKYLKEI